MGVCKSKEQQVNSVIDKQIRKDRTDKTQKLLILGPGESGKSTVLKQMRILHCDGFTTEEIDKRKSIIYSNIISPIVVIVHAMKELGIPFEKETSTTCAKLLSGVVEANKEMEALTADVVDAVKQLWVDGGVQQCYHRRAEYQLNDSAKYFIESVDRICLSDYMPNEQDMLFSRVATTGVVEINFVVDNLRFRVFDVGGQRSERKKWIHCFDDVNAVLYVTAISEYDQKLREDNDTNRLHESLTLFDSVCNSVFFVRSSIILFLNKTDLFREKLETVSMKVCFPDYTGDADYETAVAFVEERFHALNLDADNKTLYVHETCATDSDQAQRVVTSVLDTLVENSLKNAGMM